MLISRKKNATNQLISYICAYFCLTKSDKNPKITYDWLGMVLITLVLSDFALVVSEQQTWGFLSTSSIVGHLIWIVGLIIFSIVELKQSNPLVNFKLFYLTHK